MEEPGIPPIAFILVGLAIAGYSAFIGLKTDFMKFIIFFLAAAGFIAFGIIKMIFDGKMPSEKSVSKPISQRQISPISEQGYDARRPSPNLPAYDARNPPSPSREPFLPRRNPTMPPQQQRAPVQTRAPAPQGYKFPVDRYGPPINRR